MIVIRLLLTIFLFNALLTANPEIVVKCLNKYCQGQCQHQPALSSVRGTKKIAI